MLLSAPAQPTAAQLRDELGSLELAAELYADLEETGTVRSINRKLAKLRKQLAALEARP
jgi:hypothetical protein